MLIDFKKREKKGVSLKKICVFILQVAIRNIRRDAVDKVKKAEKDKAVSKDESAGYQVLDLYLCIASVIVLNIIF